MCINFRPVFTHRKAGKVLEKIFQCGIIYVIKTNIFKQRGTRINMRQFIIDKLSELTDEEKSLIAGEKLNRRLYTKSDNYSSSLRLTTLNFATVGN